MDRCLRMSLQWLVATALAFAAWPAGASEYRMLPLQREGQASVTIDDRSGTAYIVDLGKRGDGDRIEVEGKPLLQYLSEDRHVSHLVVACSHPHDDHMGGIEAWFRKPTQHFFVGGDLGRPRFKSVTVVDDESKASLDSLLASFKSTLKGKAVDIAFQHAKATDAAGLRRNAFEDLGELQQDVRIRNVAYSTRAKAGTHGRSLITLVELRGTTPVTILDTDDADSDAIAAAVDILKSEHVTHVDAFVVPHHGSRYHDVSPIFDLEPKWAIVAVNPDNRFRHPAPSVLESLIDKLGAEHVLFTGAAGELVFKDSGAVRATFTAADRESFGMFAARGEERILQKAKVSQLGAEDLASYDRLKGKMGRRRAGDDYLPFGTAGWSGDLPPDGGGNPGGGDASPPRAALSPPNGPHPGGGGGAATLWERRVAATGTIFPAGFDGVYLTSDGSSTATFASQRIFPDTLGPHGDVYIVTPQWTGSPGSAAGPPGATRVHTVSTYGYDDPASPPREVLPTQRRDALFRTGGMVYLDGGRVVAADDLGVAGASIQACGPAVCLVNSTGSHRLPFSDAQLFREVWRRVYTGETLFYLSINPMKRFLKEDSMEAPIPIDRLRFGTGAPPADATNEVVTSGNIGKSRIGQILWEADVQFKSASLGFDVRTGAGGAALTNVTPTADDFDEASRDLTLPAQSRWCRLYWGSGSPIFSIDKTSNAIRVGGNAVTANAEAMRLSGGHLESYPTGSWCKREKELAARLQYLANRNSGTAPVLGRLRELALMQSFAIWASMHGMRLEDYRPAQDGRAETAYAVPTWTSGIRSAPRTIVQEQFVRSPSAAMHAVHIYASDLDTVDYCVAPNWKQASTVWKRLGGRTDPDGAWIGDLEQRRKFDAWFTQFASTVAQCGHGRVVPPSNVLADNDDEVRQFEWRIEPHALSAQIHGGVLLGGARDEREFPQTRDERAVLWSLDRRLLLRSEEGYLHLWNRQEDAHGGAVAEHVVFTHGHVDDIHAEQGKLRLIIDTEPGAAVRHELRVKAVSDRPVALEWFESLEGSTGEVVGQQAAWPCSVAATGESCDLLGTSHPEPDDGARAPR